MQKLSNNNWLIESQGELPEIRCQRLFLDVETNGKQPFHGDRICGVAVTWDDNPNSYYIPVRHTEKKWNLPIETFQFWLKDTIQNAPEWINHYIIFDAHFCREDGAEFIGRIIDTLTLAKQIDSDRMEYGLKPLAADWLKQSNEDVDKVHSYLKSIDSDNFADVPADILGDYACGDVSKNRLLYDFMEKRRPTDIRLAWDNEIKLTPVLYDIEVAGMPINMTEVLTEKFMSMNNQIIWQNELSLAAGQEINARSNPQVYDLLINQFQLPVLHYNKNDNASFDKNGLPLYKTHPAVIADSNKLLCVDLIEKLRKEGQFCSLFLDTYERLGIPVDDGKYHLLHPSYNQCVRTGRMSCSQPNAQQLNKRAKQLIHPLPGYGIICCDYSQIEFRLMMHYIKDETAIKAFNEDPHTDFHQWVADVCNIKRKAAKVVNFGVGFGAGEAKVISMLAGNPDVISQSALKINELIEAGKLAPEDRNRAFNTMVQELSRHLYHLYHRTLPGIKLTSQQAANVARMKGYVRNAHGRRRSLRPMFAHKGFNSVVQSEAADIMKERMIALSPRYNKVTRDYGIKLFSSVHDENGMMVPLEHMRNPDVHNHIRSTLETTELQYRIPIRTSMGFSFKSWGEAGEEKPVMENGVQVAGPIN